MLSVVIVTLPVFTASCLTDSDTTTQYRKIHNSVSMNESMNMYEWTNV